MTFFVISMSLSASLVQNQNNKSKINRNPPSYFLKPDGGFAYVISKPKKQKQGGGVISHIQYALKEECVLHPHALKGQKLLAQGGH